MSIKEKIVAFISDNYLRGRKLKDSYDTSFLEQDIIDSVAVIEIVSFLEETFNIKVEDEEIVPDNLDSVNRLESYVLSKIKGAEPQGKNQS